MGTRGLSSGVWTAALVVPACFSLASGCGDSSSGNGGDDGKGGTAGNAAGSGQGGGAGSAAGAGKGGTSGGGKGGTSGVSAGGTTSGGTDSGGDSGTAAGGESGSSSGGAGSGNGGAGAAGNGGAPGGSGATDPDCPANGTITSPGASCQGGMRCSLKTSLPGLGTVPMTCDCVGGAWRQCLISECFDGCANLLSVCPDAMLPPGCSCHVMVVPPQTSGVCCCERS